MSNPSDPFNRLSEEADRLAEPFSPSLHAKVMRRVREEAAAAAVSKAPGHVLWYFGGACVAMVLIAVTVGLWMRSTQPMRPVPVQPIASADDDSLIDWLNHATEPMRQSVRQSSTTLVMGGLDHDAKAFGRFVLEQVGQLPRKPV